MRHQEPHPAEPGHRAGPGRPPDLVLIGHVGSATDRTVNGEITYVGGSGFAVAFAACALLDSAVGLVAQVGVDFDLASFQRLGLNMEGVAVLPGASATFVIDEFPDGRLSFTSDLGVAAQPRFDLFPVSYLRARYVHLGTAPPHQQLAWLDFLRDKGCQAEVSVDMFEPFVAAEPEVCLRICEGADLIFVNDVEYRGLYSGEAPPPAPTILKHGPGGAEYLADDVRHHVAAPLVKELHSIGAGEMLAGAFLALRARGLPEDDALAHAVAVATSSVTEFGVTGPSVVRELRRVSGDLGLS